MPVLLFLLGLAATFAAPWGLKRVEIQTDWDLLSVSHIAGTVFFILSAGWLFSTIVDGLMKRRLRKLHLSVENNLNARKMATQLDVMRRIWTVLAGTFTLAAALTVIPGVKQIGVSLFASAGIVGIAIGIAARPVLSNLIAGLQIAFTQPMRLNDVVVVEGEWGTIESITLFYVIIKIWDWRRLVVPLSYFTEKPFENWTREGARIIGPVYWSLDHRVPLGAMREKLTEICEASDLWDKDVINLQVTDAKGSALTVRALASAENAIHAWDLRCLIREKMITWLQEEYPEALPSGRMIAEIDLPQDENLQLSPNH
jgi:small-conductance mechanosensitive channel